MPDITQHQSSNSTKLMLIGDSGSGKTGALASLVAAGYKLRIIDLDNGLDILKNLLLAPGSSYAREIEEKKINISDAVQFVTITEHMKSVRGNIMPDKATVWVRLLDQLTEWKDGEINLGKPREWGTDVIVVIDSLTFLSEAAFNYCQSLNGQIGTKISHKGYDMRSDVGLAQRQIASLLAMLYDDGFKPNVIVTSHIVYREPEGKETSDSFGKRGYPNSIGVALAPRIPRWFNNIIQVETEGSGASTKHKLYTVSQGSVSIKTSAPLSVSKSYDISNGLAEFFKAVRGKGDNTPGVKHE